MYIPYYGYSEFTLATSFIYSNSISSGDEGKEKEKKNAKTQTLSGNFFRGKIQIRYVLSTF